MRENYDWTAYYRAAYEKEKKKNNELAEKIADEEVKAVELKSRIDNIQNNIFWRVSLPPRKAYHKLVSVLRPSESVPAKKEECVPVKTIADSEKAKQCIQAYEQEAYRQKHPYLQWIAQWEKEGIAENNNIRNEIKAESAAAECFINGWKMIPIENTDLTIIVFGHGVLDEKAEEKIKSWFNNNRNYFFAYADEDYYWKETGNRMHPWYKPCWSPDTLLSFCYIGHLIVVRQSVCDEILKQNDDWKDSYAGFYDLCLRLEEHTYAAHGTISHIEEVLFHNRYEPDALKTAQIAEAEKAGVDVLELVENLLSEELEQGYGMESAGAACLDVRKAALKRRGIQAHLESGPDPDIYHIVYEIEKKPDAANGQDLPMISVIIPSKDHPAVLERCLRSFREKTAYTDYEWIVVDNGSNAENKSRMEELQKEYGFSYLYEPMEFNFSAMCNLGASKAEGTYLLFLNDDIEIIQKDWLHIMAGQAGRPHVGAVGAKLWYAGDEAIQHVGITNLKIGPSHKLITFRDNKNYYYGRNQVTYDMIGVTAACLMVERHKYQEVGGMDETMKIAYNDVDFCFKLIEAGYYNVLRNDAVLYHYESLSRGLDEEDAGKWERLLLEKENLYAKHPGMEAYDAFYHKNLIDNASHYACNFKFDYENNLKVVELSAASAENFAEALEGVLQFTLDRAEEQHKIHRKEPDIMWLMGWSYLPGKDNARYERKIILEHEDGTLYQAKPCPWFRKDVEEVLPGEVNISLSGFVLRIRKEKLHSGKWKIGMLAADSETGQQFLTWSDKRMTVN